MTAIRLAIEGRLELAVGCIVVAAFLDGIDGRLARYLEGTSRFGAELDSLADFVNFGVVPPIVLYFWGLHDLRSLGWIGCLVFAMCMVLRLARFNVMLSDPNRPAFTANFFVGMPAPAGALAVLLPIYLDLPRPEARPAAAPFEFAYVLLIAFLTASRIPTFSGKKLGARVAGMGPAALRRAVALVLLLIFYPWETLTAIIIAYLGAIPFGVKRYRELQREHNASQGEMSVAPTPGAEP